jgi:mono/diheme cytochrome c family protein
MNKPPYSVLGLFDSPQQLLDAISAIKPHASGRLEAYTPYPVHGLDQALGLRKSPVGGMVFVMGLVGALAALGFQLWTSGIDYPLLTAGKPYLSWEAFIPILFESMVLFACFTSGLGMLLLLNRLPFFRDPMLRAGSMAKITRDKFALAVEFDGRPLDADAVSKLLRSAGAAEIEVVEQPEALGPISANFLMGSAMAILVCCLAAGYLTYWGVKLFPLVAPISHMLDQPRLDPQRELDSFNDGFGMRLPVAGTVARGHIPFSVASQEEAARLPNPVPITEATLKKGKQAFTTFCSVCHGVLGNGPIPLTAAYGAKPANLVSQQIRDYQDGKIYYVIVKGKNTMPPYAADLNEEERWSVVHYVRVLQRALNAKDSDLSKEVSR